ncbi:MAG TPA: hypothetical protein VNJ05_03355 [Sphingomicrobium sp.]|nr:hypothetical protein [Sphingomicrobium sp.]
MLSGDFAIGLMTIITGLAIADMVASTHLLFMHRERVRWDWLAVLAAVYIFMLIVSSWGISYRTMGNQMINPPLWMFVVGLSQIIPLYLSARASLPDTVDENGVSLATHYSEVSRYFWASVGFTYLMFVAYGVTILGPAVLIGSYLSPFAQLLMMVALMVTTNRRVHVVLVPIIVLLFCYDHLLSPMFSDAPWVAGPRALP